MDILFSVLFISIVFIVVGIVLRQKANRLINHGKKANAVIFKNELEAGSDGLYYPVVRFLTEKQEWITQKLNIGYNPAMEEGKKVEVLYDEEDPTNVQINSTFQLEILPVVLIVLGLFGSILVILEMFDITEIVN